MHSSMVTPKIVPDADRQPWLRLVHRSNVDDASACAKGLDTALASQQGGANTLLSIPLGQNARSR